MIWSGWVQLALYVAVLLAITRPMGLYLMRVLESGKTFLDPVLSPVERLIYRLCRIDAKREQDWKQYTLAMLVFSLVSMFLTYAILRLQHALPLNPQHLPPMSEHLAFNTAASFTTNTNWQSYGGEATLSYFSQMVGLALHNFVSAAVGIAVAAALVRGIGRHTARTIGNFWVDLVRLNLYLLLPICVVYALFLVSQGMIQNFSPYAQATAVEQVAGQAVVTQSIAQGPMASQVAIKMLGTNGGGFVNANAAHPYENPTPLSNFVQILSIFSIGAGLTYYLGRMVKKQRHGWAIWAAMFAMFLAGVLVCWNAEAGGNPRMTALGVDPAGGNMEGKEVRFGIFNSALFATITTDASCGAVNAMHDSFTPLGGLVPLFNMQTAEVIFGGVGAGLYGMLVFVVLAIFIAGLMVGRTPEYLGKKIEAYDVKASTLAVLVTANPGESFMDRMIGLIEGAKRQKTPNEIALSILLSALTIIFLVVVITFKPFAAYANVDISVTVLVALLVCLIPTTIGGLLSAIGIAGIDRMVQKNVLAMSGRAVEAAGDVDVLLLDKTGTITLGDRHATEFIAAPGVEVAELADAAQLSSLADETPEGRSIVVLAKQFGIRGREIHELPNARFVPFTAQTRMSGVDMDGRTIRKGAAEAVRVFINSSFPPQVDEAVNRISRDGGTPLAVATDKKVLGVIHLKDIVKGGLPDRFKRFRAMGIRTVMITGDNPLTAAAIAKEAGVDDFLAQATPEDKLALIRREQAAGHLVAMTGDGTNDAPALAQADVGVAMNTGTQAAKEAGNMVDLDSNPTKLIEVVEIGKQLLITRGALTTFSIANDVAKYFAIIPALLVGAFPLVAPLNVMGLGSPNSAILSAVIFNALIIVALIPLALRGVQFRPMGAGAILRRNMLIYGLGGLIVPFPGIKLVDVVVNLLHLV